MYMLHTVGTDRAWKKPAVSLFIPLDVVEPRLNNVIHLETGRLLFNVSTKCCWNGQNVEDSCRFPFHSATVGGKERMTIATHSKDVRRFRASVKTCVSL